MTLSNLIPEKKFKKEVNFFEIIPEQNRILENHLKKFENDKFKNISVTPTNRKSYIELKNSSNHSHNLKTTSDLHDYSENEPKKIHTPRFSDSSENIFNKKKQIHDETNDNNKNIKINPIKEFSENKLVNLNHESQTSLIIVKNSLSFSPKKVDKNPLDFLKFEEK